MSLVIRPWTPADHTGMQELDRTDGAQINADELAQMAASQSPEFPLRALVAEHDGQMIGRALAGRRPWTPAGDLNCSVLVAPAHRRQGVGAALWDGLAPFLGVHRPANLLANGSDDQTDGLAWAERRGFEKRHHIVGQELDLSAFDPAAFAGDIARTEAVGIRFVQFDQVRSPEGESTLHRLYHEANAATPDAEPNAEPRPLAEWSAWAFGLPESWPAGCTVAIAANGEWIGFSLLHKWAPDAPKAHIFMTGVVPAWRGRGVGLALKVICAEYAQQNGVTAISTITHWENAAMRAVNERLGYRTGYGFWRLVRPRERA